MHAIHTAELDGYTVKVFPDETPSNPRTDQDNVGHMVSFYSRDYMWGDEQLSESAETRQNGWKDLRREAIPRAYRRYKDAAVFLWIEHRNYDSTLRVTNEAEDADGFIYCTREQVDYEWGEHHYPNATDGKTPLQRAEAYLRAEVEEASAYYSGDVYGYVVEDESGDEVDSCWGFYGYSYAIEEAERALTDAVHSARRATHDAAMFEVVESAKVERMMHV